MNQPQQFALDFTTATARAEVGIERSATKANRVLPGWTDSAAELLREAARCREGEFTIEAMRVAITRSIEAPPDLRAWGHVTRRAVQLGYIQRVPGHFAAAASSNGSPKPLYRRGPNV